MYLKIFIIFIVVLILLSVYLNLNKEEVALSKEKTPLNDNTTSEESPEITTKNSSSDITSSDTDYDNRIYGKKVNYIGGSDVYSSLPVSMDKTGYYSYNEGCNSCKKYALGWRCKAHKYNNMKNVSLVPEGLLNMCYTYTKKTPLLYDGVRSITNSTLA